MVLYAHKHAYKNTYFGFLLDIWLYTNIGKHKIKNEYFSF